MMLMMKVTLVNDGDNERGILVNTYSKLQYSALDSGYQTKFRVNNFTEEESMLYITRTADLSTSCFPAQY